MDRFLRCAAGWVSAAGVMMMLAGAARADERKYTYSNEAKTLPQGEWEVEPWATMRSRKEAGEYRHWDFRLEVEHGITDRLTGAVYLNFEYEGHRDVPQLKDEHEFKYESTSLEAKYKLTDPVADLVGTLLYGEITLESDEYELELKGILNKEIGDLSLVYNFIFESELEKEIEPSGEEEWEKEFLIEQTFGASLRVLEPFNFGGEFVMRSPWEDGFEDRGQTVYFVGPNAHFRSSSWWATLTVLKQVDLSSTDDLDLDHWTKYEVRLIIGIDF